MTFVLASNNPKKVVELRRILAQVDPYVKILSLRDIGYDGDIIETGETFEENALIKASVPASLGYIGIADDSGLCVDALDGAPGVYSARYSGGDDNANNEKLLDALRNVPDGKRSAHYECVIACVFPEGSGIDPIITRGQCFGRILKDYHGSNAFGYDPLFYRDEEGCTFAEMSPADKDKVSHRGIALRKLSEALAECFPRR